jgi:ribosomal protein S1
MNSGITNDLIHEQLTLTARSTTLWQGTVDSKLTQMGKVIWAVISVLVLGFITLLVTVAGLVITYQHDSQDVYQQSRNATNAQNDKIEEVTKQISNLVKAQQETLEVQQNVQKTLQETN